MMTAPRILTLSAAILLTVSAQAQDRPNPAEEVSAAKIKELQKERIDTLKAVAEMSSKLAASGRAPVEEALEARLLLLQAETEAASTDAARIQLYTDSLDTLQEFEKLAIARKQAALATEVPILKIKSRRLEIEILREQARARETRKAKSSKGTP